MQNHKLWVQNYFMLKVLHINSVRSS